MLEAFHASVGHDVREFAADIQCRRCWSPPSATTSPRSPRSTGWSAFPDARLEVIPEVGHLIHYETPATPRRASSRFLRSGALA